MDSNISFLLFSFWGLISNFQLEITFICSLSLFFTFFLTEECNLLFSICHFLSLLVRSGFKIKLAHFKQWNYVSFFCCRPWTVLKTHSFVWFFLKSGAIFIYLFFGGVRFKGNNVNLLYCNFRVTDFLKIVLNLICADLISIALHLAKSTYLIAIHAMDWLLPMHLSGHPKAASAVHSS